MVPKDYFCSELFFYLPEAERGVSATDEYPEEEGEDGETGEDKEEEQDKIEDIDKISLKPLLEEGVIMDLKPPPTPPPTSRKVHWSPTPRRVRPEPDLSPRVSPVDKSPTFQRKDGMSII